MSVHHQELFNAASNAFCLRWRYCRLLTACEVAGFDANKRIRYNNDKMSEIDRKYEMAKERAEGKSEGRTEVARTMLEKGLDTQIVAECTMLSIEQVEKLRQSL